MKEISAQKLCAGTVPMMTARRAGGLYEKVSFDDTWACEAAVVLLLQCCCLTGPKTAVAACFRMRFAAHKRHYTAVLKSLQDARKNAASPLARPRGAMDYISQTLPG
jgi:hypothetical protein